MTRCIILTPAQIITILHLSFTTRGNQFSDALRTQKTNGHMQKAFGAEMSQKLGKSGAKYRPIGSENGALWELRL